MRLAPLYRARYGTFGTDELGDELARHLPPDTEIVMVHSSLDGLQPMYSGDFREVLDALIDLCGTHRTLAMPAFFFGGRTLDPIAYFRERPVFDVRRQPSETGLLTELFRRRKGVRRSLHPVHSVIALGPQADDSPTEKPALDYFAVQPVFALEYDSSPRFQFLTGVHERFPQGFRFQPVPTSL